MRTAASFAPSSRALRAGLAVLLAILVWALGLAGAFRPVDGMVYDAFMRTRAGGDRRTPAVLVIELDSPEFSSSESKLVGLLEQLFDLEAAQIVLDFLPPDDWLEVYSLAREQEVVFGQALEADPFEPERLVPVPLPPTVRRYELEDQIGAVSLPPVEGGVYRGQHLELETVEGTYPGLEVVAARRRLGERGPTGGDFLVDFVGGADSLPNLTATRATSGDLIRELVAGRSVLVGRRTIPGVGELYTPTTTGLRRMSGLEYRGQALDTLLRGGTIRRVGAVTRLVAVVSLVLVLAALFHYLGVRIASWAVVLLALIHVGASFAAFIYVDAWLPVTDALLCLGLTFVFALRRSTLEMGLAMRSLISDATEQMRDKYWPTHFYNAAPPWSLIAHMINQTLDLNKVIFLEAVPHQPRVREILALHCALEDIVENRRDYRRSPYTDALAAREPLKVEHFMRRTSDEEEQYLAPLVFCGEILGFWAIGIEQSKAAAIPLFTNILSDYTTRMSELLYHARRMEKGGNYDRGQEGGSGTMTFESTFQSLRSTLGLLQYRLTTLEALLNRLDAGVIVYDVFGRALQINEMMLSTLRREGLAPFEMTALDLVLALSDYDVSKARRVLRRVVVDNQRVSFPVALRSAPSSRFLLHLKPLLEDVQESQRPFAERVGARNILCELVDATSMTRLNEMKAQLTDRLGLQIRDELASIELAAGLLRSGKLGSGGAASVAGVVQTKVRDTVYTLSECRRYLEIETGEDDLERFPVDARSALREVIEEAKDAADQRGITLELQEPNFLSYVLAASEKLRQMFTSILEVLCQDAADGSTVVVRVNETENVVLFDFSNVGYGIPNELLNEYLFGGQVLASPELQSLQSAVRWVESWGGGLEAVSGVGVGMHFTVQLAKFL